MLDKDAEQLILMAAKLEWSPLQIKAALERVVLEPKCPRNQLAALARAISSLMGLLL
jgi:hypothetical protein